MMCLPDLHPPLEVKSGYIFMAEDQERYAGSHT